MGSFFAAALFPVALIPQVKETLSNSSYYLLTKSTESYAYVSEKEMDAQREDLLMQFGKNTSEKSEQPIFTFLVYDSDVLDFCVFHQGKRVYYYSNDDAYFSGGEVVVEGNDEIIKLLKLDKEKWESVSNKKRIEEFCEAEDYLAEFLKLLNLPEWTYNVGFNYIENDPWTMEDLKKAKVEIFKHGLE